MVFETPSTPLPEKLGRLSLQCSSFYFVFHIHHPNSSISRSRSSLSPVQPEMFITKLNWAVTINDVWTLPHAYVEIVRVCILVNQSGSLF